MPTDYIEVPTFAGLFDEVDSRHEHASWAGPSVHYEVKCTPYYSRTIEVRHCTTCGKRLKVGASGLSRDNLGAGQQLVSEVALSRGQADPIPSSTNRTTYGSGWWLELPIYVCSIIDEAGIEAAREYVNWIFDQGSSRDATDKLYARCPQEVKNDD